MWGSWVGGCYRRVEVAVGVGVLLANFRLETQRERAREGESERERHSCQHSTVTAEPIETGIRNEYENAQLKKKKKSTFQIMCLI